MASQEHPRRRGFKSPSPPLMTPTMGKTETFHSPSSMSSDLFDPTKDFVHSPKRSRTSVEELESLVQDASGLGITRFLDSFKNNRAGLSSSVTGANLLSDTQVLPLPTFMLHNTSINEDAMDIDTKPPVEEGDQFSDSGLGSSISGHSLDRSTARRSSTRRSVRSSATSAYSTVTGSATGLSSVHSQSAPILSDYASSTIRRYIIEPILKEESLKEFHPLIRDIPRRIGEKNISSLRDLEKSLVWLAPEFAVSAKSYFKFCQQSIRCIIATVPHLSERDQRRPTDRPYTNNYVLDLVEQIRQYAAVMAETRKKEAAGEELDAMDYSRDEKITLRGGLSHNGRPMELVREKNGKVIPIAADSTINDSVETPPSFKRPLDVASDDDAVLRSMARRRKSDRPGDVKHICSECKKDFKRPCDLTKHEKTHSRPHKCPDVKCKYHELGWPTEKERDRHVNDKHSAAPPMYRCLFPPCPYASKRESNCKQHMEKSHNYEYVRSKSNGRKKAATTASGNRTPSTPLTPFIATPLTPSPAVRPYNDFSLGGFGYTPAFQAEGLQSDMRRASVTTAGSAMTYSSGHSPAQGNSFDDVITPEESDFDHNNLDLNPPLNWNAINYQQPTPALSSGPGDFNDLSGRLSLVTDFGGNTGAVPHLSPGAQADITLYSPQVNDMQIDEGFGEGGFRPDGDFTLFDSNTNIGLNGPSDATLFGDLPSFRNMGSHFDNTFYPMGGSELDDLLDPYNGQH